MMEPAHAGSASPRAFLRLGGATLAHHQLVIALAAGCERIICVGRALDSDMVALQHEAERAGARFHMISGPRALSGLITANDELLVFSDGLVPSSAEALDLIGQTPSVLVLPAESAVPLGFERIDLNLAGAGLMLLPGRLVERLNELSADSEPASALLRIALQAGITQRSVPQSIAAGGRWLLVRDEDQAHAAEMDWMERHTTGLGKSPGLAIASFGVRSFGPALLHAGSNGRVLALSAVLLTAIAAGFGWFEFYATALGLCTPAWLLHRAANIIEKIQCEALGKRPGFLAGEAPFNWLLDAVIGVLLLAAIPFVPGETWWDRAFTPFMLFGLLQLVPRIIGGRWADWLTDRMLLALLLCGLSLGQVLQFGVPGLACLLLLAAVFVPRLHSRADGITRA